MNRPRQINQEESHTIGHFVWAWRLWSHRAACSTRAHIKHAGVMVQWAHN